jgi:hypothetical protein
MRIIALVLARGDFAFAPVHATIRRPASVMRTRDLDCASTGDYALTSRGCKPRADQFNDEIDREAVRQQY